MARKHKKRESKEYIKLYSLMSNLRQDCYKDLDSLCKCLCPAGKQSVKPPETNLRANKDHQSDSSKGFVQPEDDFDPLL